MNPQNPNVCELCRERPGAVRVMFSNGLTRRSAVLCELCAHQTMGQGVVPPAGGPGAMPQGGGPGAPGGDAPKSPLAEFGRNLTEDAREGRIDPVVGRDDEIAQTVEILARRRKNNAVLIGEAGVGKTAIAEGLA